MSAYAAAVAEADLNPTGLIQITVDGLIEVCRTMQGLELKSEGAPVLFSDADAGRLEVGSFISLVRPGKAWNLALFGTAASCQVLGRGLLGMGPTDPIGNDELADALGEILNMMAGVTKRKLPAADASQVQLGLPMFLSGTDCFRYLAKGIRVFCQRVRGPEVDFEVIIVWKEG